MADSCPAVGVAVSADDGPPADHEGAYFDMDAQVITQPTESNQCTESSRRPLWPELLLIVIAVLPFQLVHLGPILRDDAPATGFILYDMPYYVANGREAFERGNGWMYPNPYDCSEDAPAIYFHWLLWLFGFCTVKLGMDPGLLFAGTGVLGSLLMAGVTWKLIKSVLPDARWRKSLFLLTMWGGGLLCAGKLLVNILTGQSLWLDILAYDTHLGFWFFSWGRNSIYATEAVYHLLAIGAWYFAYQRRYWRSVILAGLLATTHPWSGLEVLGTFAAFLGLRALVRHTQPAWRLAVTTAIMLCMFFAYNLWYLNLHESHRALYDVWHINWSLAPITMLLAYVPIGFFALRALSAQMGANPPQPMDRERAEDSHPDGPSQLPTEWQAFLITCFVCAFLLATHDRFVAHAKQPLHFTRGFIWMPLCLLALPYLQQLIIRWTRWSARPTIAVAMLLGLACFDNVVFLSHTAHTFWADEWDVQTMRTTERDMLDWIDEQGVSGVLACPDQVLGYLSATYTGMIPYVGHQFNTPDLAARQKQLAAWFAGEEDARLESRIDFVLISRDEVATAKFGAKWATMYENAEFLLLEKASQELALRE